jgi:hypothetical protein
MGDGRARASQGERHNHRTQCVCVSVCQDGSCRVLSHDRHTARPRVLLPEAELEPSLNKLKPSEGPQESPDVGGGDACGARGCPVPRRETVCAGAVRMYLPVVYYYGDNGGGASLHLNYVHLSLTC